PALRSQRPLHPLSQRRARPERVRRVRRASGCVQPAGGRPATVAGARRLVEQARRGRSRHIPRRAPRAAEILVLKSDLDRELACGRPVSYSHRITNRPTPPLPGRVRVKLASEPWELDQVHALNHKTFAVEIPRYERAPGGRLVDRFHDENTYVVSPRGRRVAGMMAIRDKRPFSLDER